VLSGAPARNSTIVLPLQRETLILTLFSHFSLLMLSASRNDDWRPILDDTTEIPRSFMVDHGLRLHRPRERVAEKSTRGVFEMNLGSWGALDQSNPSNVGVGLFFQKDKRTENLFVSSIAPGSSAFRSGKITIGDELISLNEEKVVGWNLVNLRSKLQDMPGTFVSLELVHKRMKTGSKHKGSYKINLMRGSAHFIEFCDRKDFTGQAIPSETKAATESEPFNSQTYIQQVRSRTAVLLNDKAQEQNRIVWVEECLRQEQQALEAQNRRRQECVQRHSQLCQKLSELEIELEHQQEGGGLS
jgi:hypothetical protein